MTDKGKGERRKRNMIDRLIDGDKGGIEIFKIQSKSIIYMAFTQKWLFYLQVIGAALVHILIAVMLINFINIYRITNEKIYCAISFLAILIAMTLLNIYLNAFQWRHHFPYDWICCMTVAVLLSIGVACTLGNQFTKSRNDLHNILEVLIIMCFGLLLGLWVPKIVGAVLYIILSTLFLLIIVYINVLIVYLACVECDILSLVSHCVVWVTMLPMLLFQAQILHGVLSDSQLPVLDKPLLALLLLVDFLFCYVFLSSIDKIFSDLEMWAPANWKMYGRVYNHYFT